MGSAVELRTDYSASELRRLARASQDARQSSRLLWLAAVLDGMSRADAARIGGMDRQTLREWVHRFNEAGPEGLKDAWKNIFPALPYANLARLLSLLCSEPCSEQAGVPGGGWQKAPRVFSSTWHRTPNGREDAFGGKWRN
ncbi:helix-turn-helix domain-containing protein [Mesorhizobium sp. L103C105A0]|uniref:helix-turn-helix domain-containing protein n=1 Tax=Mesorhizobium sp. L103C105A0 TaxID=1287074 RepID=UPI0009DE6065